MVINFLRICLVINFFYYLLCSWTNPIFGKNLVPDIEAKILSANHVGGFLNQVFHQNKLMKQPHYGLWTLKLTVSQEWVDGINWIFACWYRFTKIKSWSKIYWVSLVKNGCDQSGQSKIYFISKMNRWNKLIFCLLVQIQES